MMKCSAVFFLTLWCAAQCSSDLERFEDGEASDNTSVCADTAGLLQTIVVVQSDSKTANEDRSHANGHTHTHTRTHRDAADCNHGEQLRKLVQDAADRFRGEWLWEWVQEFDLSSGATAMCVISLLMLSLLAVEFSGMFVFNGVATQSTIRASHRCQQAEHSGDLVWWLWLSTFPSLAYASAIVGAYDLAQVLGGNAVLSGLLISICPAASALGVVYARVAVAKSTLWHARQLVISYLIMGLAALGCCFCGLPGVKTWFVFACRCVLGFASGVSCFIRNDAKTRALSSEQLEKAMLFDSVGLGLGLVLGPLISSWIEHVLIVWNYGKALALGISGGCFTTAVAPLLCVLIYIKVPRVLSTQSPLFGNCNVQIEVPDTQGPSRGPSRLPQEGVEPKDAMILIVSGLLQQTAGHFLCQYIEVGTALILETFYKWPTATIGSALGLSLTGALPLTVFLDAWIFYPEEHSMKWQRMQYCVCLCLPACCLYLPLTGVDFPGWLLVLGADMLIFAVGICFTARSQSMMLSVARAGNKSVEDLLLMLEIAYLGRGASGPAARYLLSQRIGFVEPLSNYMIGMLLFVLTIFVTLTLFFRPAVRACTSLLDNMASETREISDEMMWSYTRIKPEAGVMELVVLILWAPFGIALAALRLVALPLLPIFYGFFRLFGLGAAQVFYSAWMPLMLGIWVKARGQRNLWDSNARIIVGNHISDFDSPVLSAEAPCESLSFVANEHLRAVCSLLQMLGFPSHGIWVADGQAKEAIRYAVCEDIANSSRRVAIFPEGNCTNGRGVLRFKPFVFSLEQDVLPFSIQYYNPWPVEFDFIGTTFLCNLFWLFFLPLTVYTLTFLPQASKADGESTEEYGDRIQRQIADDLGVPATKFSTTECRLARALQSTFYSG